MRTSGKTIGAGGDGASAISNHPILVRAAESVGRLARITRGRGTRAVVLAEKSVFGWAARPAARRRGAFTRVELCVCLAAAALLAMLALPALAASQSRGHVAQCLNNLRLMGRAVQMWASDYTGQPPWRTLQTDGGLMPISGSRPGNAWFDYLSLSNQLGTPRILACPADQGVLMASDFTFNINGGYASVAYRARATSYSLNLESLTEQPQVFLAGDLNINLIGATTGCQTRVNNASIFNNFSADNHVWTNRVHGVTGNIVTMDGSVAPTSSEEMRASLKVSDDNGSVHLLRAR